jgi:hypothetical protein
MITHNSFEINNGCRVHKRLSIKSIWAVVEIKKFKIVTYFLNTKQLKCNKSMPGAYLGICHGGCTFLADLPPPF